MTMVERVAKAIQDAEQMHWNDMARAAIEAMREPTMAMESAASNWQGPQMTYSDVWRAMIDEAIDKVDAYRS